MTECKKDFIPNVIRVTDLADISINAALRQQVLEIMTPPEIFQLSDFAKPEVIHPQNYPNFDSLMVVRHRISRLELLPIKTEEEHKWYHQQPPELLSRLVMDCLGNSPLALAPERFPNFLPEDVGQYMVWMKNIQANRDEVAEFTTKCMQLLGLNSSQVILFERPTNISTRLVRGSFPVVRHMHFWRKINSLTN